MKKGFWHDITLPLTNWSRYFNRKKKKSWTPQTPGCSYLIKCWHCFCRELKHLEHKEILSVWCSSFGSSPSPYLQYAQEIHKEAPGGLFLPFSCFFIILCSSSSDPVRYHEIHVIWIGGNKYFVDLFFQKYLKRENCYLFR